MGNWSNCCFIVQFMVVLMLCCVAICLFGFFSYGVGVHHDHHSAYAYLVLSLILHKISPYTLDTWSYK